MTFSASSSKILGSRKKLVTLMSRSLARTLELARVLAQKVEIPAAIGGRRQRHASLDPAQQRPRLVEREIVRGLGAQKIDDLVQALGRRDRPAGRPWDRPRRIFAGVFGEGVRDLRHGKHEIDGARHDRAARHAVETGLVRILCDDEPALFLDRLQSDAAVGAGSREDDADGALAELFRQSSAARSRRACARRGAPAASRVGARRRGSRDRSPEE